MVLETSLEPDPVLEFQEIVLPAPQVNPDWPQASGYANHAMHHLFVEADLKPAWKADVGVAAGDFQPRLPPPVVANGQVFAMDAEHAVSALDATTGKLLWQAETAVEDEDDHIPGGIATEGNRVFAGTGFAEVVALDAGTGAELWRRSVDAPIHAPPTARDDRVFVVTISNTLTVLDATTGTTQWTYEGIQEVASLIGGADPAVDDSVVVAPFTSGELIAFQAESGRVLWGDSLASGRRTDELANLSQIRAAPVIDRGRVLAVSYGGVIAAIDLLSGRRIWDADIGSLSKPWVAGRYIFVTTTDGELVCLNRDTGGIHWVVELPAYEDPVEREGPIMWQGPVLVGDRLILTSTNGWAMSVSPYDGRMLGREFVEDPISLAPVVANGTLFFLSDEAWLFAYR